MLAGEWAGCKAWTVAREVGREGGRAARRERRAWRFAPM
jgi:hypothetical protein